MLHVINQYNKVFWHKEFSSRLSKFTEIVTLQCVYCDCLSKGSLYSTVSVFAIDVNKNKIDLIQPSTDITRHEHLDRFFV